MVTKKMIEEEIYRIGEDAKRAFGFKVDLHVKEGQGILITPHLKPLRRMNVIHAIQWDNVILLANIRGQYV